MELKVMTFNLRVNTPEDRENAWPYRIHRAGAVIRELEPVVIGTQEGFYSMLRDLDGELPGYRRIGEGRLGYESGLWAMDECCAIYYRDDLLTPLEHGQFWLSKTPDVPGSKSWDSSLPRFCTWVRFQVKNGSGHEFYVLNTHFDHLGERAREESARLILDFIARRREEYQLPVILMGDLNEEPDKAGVATLGESLLDAYTACAQPVGRTFHEYAGGLEGEPIDYLFVTPDIQLEETVVHRQQVDGGYPSDHYPVTARVVIG